MTTVLGLLLAAPVRAQERIAPDDTARHALSEPRRITGRIVRPGGKAGLIGVPGVMITLHRVGQDGAGPVDSLRSGADGHYDFRYKATGNPDALYFVSVVHDGIAYFSSPTKDRVIAPGEGDVTVYDTTSAPIPIRVTGRHLVVAGPSEDGSRVVAEVFELENDSSVTRVGRDTTVPTWTVHLPAEAKDARVTEGDVAPGAVRFVDGEAQVFAPLSPGIRQLVLTYHLGPDAFPLSLPVEHPVVVMEVLTEEPAAVVEGARLQRVEDTDLQGNRFSRYLAQDVPANSVVRVTMPRTQMAAGKKVLVWLSVGIVAAMLFALGWVLMRRRREEAGGRREEGVAVPLPSRLPPLPSASLAREIAALDAQFERAAPDDPIRASYAARREELKARLAAALAAERQGG